MIADAAGHRLVVTAEDGLRDGGAGSAMATAIIDHVVEPDVDAAEPAERRRRRRAARTARAGARCAHELRAARQAGRHPRRPRARRCRDRGRGPPPAPPSARRGRRPLRRSRVDRRRAGGQASAASRAWAMTARYSSASTAPDTSQRRLTTTAGTPWMPDCTAVAWSTQTSLSSSSSWSRHACSKVSRSRPASAARSTQHVAVGDRPVVGEVGGEQRGPVGDRRVRAPAVWPPWRPARRGSCATVAGCRRPRS